MRRGLLPTLALFGGLLAGGCAFGPRALEKSHKRYNEAVRAVTAEEQLLNLVRLRYSDTVMRLDVAAIAAQYELDTSAEARPFFSTEGVNLNPPVGPFGTFSQILPFVGASLTDRPTFSLNPLDDSDAVRPLFVPATLDGIIFLAETSWPISTVFQLYVEYLNFVPNAPSASGPDRGVIPEFREFQRVVWLLQSLKDAGRVQFVRSEKIRIIGGPLPESAVSAAALVEAAKSGYEYRPRADKMWDLVKLDRKLELRLDPAVVGSPEVCELCELLNLQIGRTEYEIVIGGMSFPRTRPPEPTSTITIVPRSTVQALFFMSYGIEIPDRHMECGLVKPTVEPDGRVFDWSQVTAGFFAVHSTASHCRPKNAYAAVRYRDRWFYIDDSDVVSKTTFSLMNIMSRLDLLAVRKGGPALTLPVGR